MWKQQNHELNFANLNEMENLISSYRRIYQMLSIVNKEFLVDLIDSLDFDINHMMGF